LRSGHLKRRLVSISLAFIVIFSVLGITAVHSQEWVPTLPPWPDSVWLEATSIRDNAYVKVEMTFPNGGYDVNWGSVTRIDSVTFSADAEMWMWTGPVILVIIDESHVYDLGALPPGAYEFIFNVWGIPIRRLQFSHPIGLKDTFRFENLYKLSLNLELYLEEGSKLVIKFYTWGDVYQAECVFENFAPPENVVKFDNVPHPLGMAVEKAVLLVTTDNTEEVISTIATWTTRRSNLIIRMSQSKSGWDLALPPGKTALISEISGIKGKWPLAPT